MEQKINTPKWQQRFSEGWQQIIGAELEADYFRQILTFLHQEKLAGKTIYPAAGQVFDAFHLCPYKDLKVVLLGQDPYHGYGQAHGLAFSVQSGIPLPPSLRNIYQELKSDLNIDRGSNGALSDWAKQGVLLLNASLTVEDGKAASHQHIGWQTFTDAVIQKISLDKKGIVFILWGGFAAKKEILIDHAKHHILKSPHPSPLSAHRGFFSSRPFSRTNELLQQEGRKEIQWG